ncbi:MAG: protein kinase [Gemmatimonadaceae bacterium]|nr:protein kinase [Gemmatimonadaceae bacterium]
MSHTPSQEFLELQQALAGRYSLERELGRGGMGVVYLAREVRLDRPVALKLLPATFAAQRTLRERFLREARTAARLSHPHIVPIHAVDEVGDFVFMVMSYVEGQTLEQRVRDRGPLAATDAARILREVAWALAYAHAQGVVHRDIKPANILLEAGSGRSLVTDFGIAHVSDAPSLTSGAEVMGTAEYMSPEQAAGESVDGRSDLYALGVVGYYMLSGGVPFAGPTVAATLAKQITQAAAPLTSVAPGVPAPLAHAIDRCLAKDPAARFEGGEQLAEALGSALERHSRIPMALHVFNERMQHASRPMAAMAMGSLFAMTMSIMVASDSALLPAGFVLVTSIFSAFLASTPVAMVVQMVRRLLRSGYGRDELLRALRIQTEERRETLASERTPPPSRWDRLILRAGVTALLANVAGLVYMIVGPYFPAFETVVVPMMNVAGVTYMGAGLYLGSKHIVGSQVPGELGLKFWKSRVGRWLFKLAGLGLDRQPAVGASYRPTELAIGMAAERLFEDLPPEVRESFSGLPLHLRALELHAENARARIAELDEIAHTIEQGGARDGQRGSALAGGSAGQRQGAADEIRAARSAAEQRLSDAVGALETIRLQLLRMHAGIGSAESMTEDLTAALRLSRDLEYLLEGRREVDQVLKLEKRSATGNTPVPA